MNSFCLCICECIWAYLWSNVRPIFIVRLQLRRVVTPKQCQPRLLPLKQQNQSMTVRCVMVCVITCWRRACACALVIAGIVCLWKSNPLIWIPEDRNTVNEPCRQRNGGEVFHCGLIGKTIYILVLLTQEWGTEYEKPVEACSRKTNCRQVEGKPSFFFLSESSCDGDPKSLHSCMNLVGESSQN